MMIYKIKEQLAWRGPNGKVMGHIVLTRADAERLVEDFELLAADHTKLAHDKLVKGHA